MSRPRSTARFVRVILALALLATAAWLNATALIEAYGAGPPYHGRTINMDKWSDPLPWLLPLDVVVLAAALALTYRKPRRPS